MKATQADYDEITRIVSDLSSNLKASIMAQGHDAISVIGKQIFVNLPLNAVSELCKEVEGLKARNKQLKRKKR